MYLYLKNQVRRDLSVFSFMPNPRIKLIHDMKHVKRYLLEKMHTNHKTTKFAPPPRERQRDRQTDRQTERERQTDREGKKRE